MTSGPIVCVGSGVIDRVLEIDEPLRPGAKLDVKATRLGYGGPAATAAVAIAALGGHAAWWGRVGNDQAGAALLRRLGKAGVDTSGVSIVEGGRTTEALVVVDRHGERTILVHRGGLPSEALAPPAEALANAAVVLADTRWPSASGIAFDCARARSVPCVLDADGGPAEVMRALVAKADHVVFSDQGLTDLTGQGDARTRLAALPGAGVLAVTCGEQGSLWRIGDDFAVVPAVPVEVRDTTGCGDVFHGAYALAIAEGEQPLFAARFASVAAALKARRGAGWDGMPGRPEVLELMARSRLS